MARISQRTYRRIMRGLRAEAKGLGVVVKIRRISPFTDGFRVGVRGAYHTTKKMICLRIRGKVGHAQVIQVLLHELRHAEHHYLGLYANYYDPRAHQMWRWLRGKGPRPWGYIADTWIGLEAEEDCEHYAVQRMKRLKLPHKLERYEMAYVYTHGIQSELDERPIYKAWLALQKQLKK